MVFVVRSSSKAHSHYAAARRLMTALWLAALSLCALAAGAAPTSATLSRERGSAIPLDPPAAPEAHTPSLAGITPPLSIDESCQMLSAASRLLAAPNVTSATTVLQYVDRLLYSIVIYVDRVDRAHPTLPFYAWQNVSSEKSPREGWETQIFRLSNPIPQVTALALKSHHGDLEIKYLAAIDQNQTRWEFTKAIKAPADQPRPEIFFLPLPTQLSEVRITCRRGNAAQRWPRLVIDAGISSIPESAKEAQYYLQRARNSIKGRQTADARNQILKAYSHLREYQKNRRF